MKRLLALGVILVAACGGGGGGGGGGSGGAGGGGGAADLAACASFASDLNAILRAHQSCAVDSDCHWLADGCLNLCNSFVNSDGADAARSVVDQATAAGCNAGCECLAQLPACNAGICGARQHP
jgi:hypothetical protein